LIQKLKNNTLLVKNELSVVINTLVGLLSINVKLQLSHLNAVVLLNLVLKVNT